MPDRTPKTRRKIPGQLEGSKLSPIRIGFGEFFNPNSKLPGPRDVYRQRFLVVAAELYGVTRDLKDSVLQYLPSAGYPLELAPVRDPLQAWCSRHNLCQPWVLEQVGTTLALWKLDPQFSRLSDSNPPWHPIFEQHASRIWPAASESFAFQYLHPYVDYSKVGEISWSESAGWHVEQEFRADFEAEARRQFEHALRNYCDGQEVQALQRGLVKNKRFRNRGIQGDHKLRWTVQRHCGAMEFEAIAQVHQEFTGQTVDVSTVIKAVSERARMIGL